MYRNFAAEYDRLQAERIAAFSEYKTDVLSNAFPDDKHLVRMQPTELAAFLGSVDSDRSL